MSKKKQSAAQALFLFPHQLFEHHELLDDKHHIVLIEASHFFYRFAFHQQKLILHRATMQAYAAMLTKRGLTVAYFDHVTCKKNLNPVFAYCREQGITDVDYIDLVDHQLDALVVAGAKHHNLTLTCHQSPSFMLTRSEVINMLGAKKRYLMASFYTKIRKHTNILMRGTKPLGNTWSLDAQNRQSFPPSMPMPPLPRANNSTFVRQAKENIAEHFSDNPGKTARFIYPVTHEASRAWLETFLAERFKDFGPYQDAISSEHPFGFHSLLSPLLNIGLLEPDYVVQRIVAYAQKHKIPLNSCEGLVRQLIGWREFVRGIYVIEGTKQEKLNVLKHHNKLPASFWKATTGVQPLDATITKVLDYAYAHHIERLMVLGNFMLVTETDPHEVYRWFMELFIDAYDWVMIPNVYGMSQYADGGLITTKPYCSGSSYISKMSNYPKGPWCDLWNALYWHFIHKHQTTFAKNPRMSLAMAALKKMNPTKLTTYLKTATTYLKKLHHA